jgi:flavodoxin
MSKKLVTYFSVSGVTAGLAKTLSKATGADIYEIKPEVTYTKADLNWEDTTSRSTLEQQDLSSRPAIADKNANIADYEVIFVGFPIWWHIAPTLINTFLESYDFSGKTIILFATSGSEEFGGTKEKLQPSVSDTTIITEGKVIKSSSSKEELTEWLDSLNL